MFCGNISYRLVLTFSAACDQGRQLHQFGLFHSDSENTSRFVLCPCQKEISKSRELFYLRFVNLLFYFTDINCLKWGWICPLHPISFLMFFHMTAILSCFSAVHIQRVWGFDISGIVFKNITLEKKKYDTVTQYIWS